MHTHHYHRPEEALSFKVFTTTEFAWHKAKCRASPTYGSRIFIYEGIRMTCVFVTSSKHSAEEAHSSVGKGREHRRSQ